MVGRKEKTSKMTKHPKKLVAIFLLILSALVVILLPITRLRSGYETGWTVSGSHVYNNMTGVNVGIGTDNPAAMLSLADPLYRGDLRIFDNMPSSHGHDIGYDGGIDGLFWFSHFGIEDGETRFIWDTKLGHRDLFVIKNTGNIGIGTTRPSAKLSISGGDAAIITQGNGLVLRADNGNNCYRLTVNNNGSLNTILVTCPS